MSRRTLGFIVFALVLAAGCIRLGVWQLSRLGERRALNREMAARLGGAMQGYVEATRDSATARYRHVQLAGRYDYARELVLTSRARSGAPGVWVLTPVVTGTGVPVLVNRGWAYAADGMTVDLARWREGDSATVEGYLEEFVPARGMVSTPSQPRGIRHLVRDSVEARLGERVAPFVVVQRLGGEQRDSIMHLMRLPEPLLDEGSHRSYAVQWFSFAAIAVVGAAVVAGRGRSTA